MLPFSTEQFLQVFATFNVAIWPAQIVAYGVGLLAAAGVARSSPTSDRVASTSLAAMWLFTGISYHWLSFARVNPAANLFGAAFVLQAGLLCYAGFIGRLRFGFTPSLRAAAGLVLTIYAAAIYPIIGLLLHGYPAVPLFGVTPCPVTIFTLGCFLMTRSPVPWWVLAIPLLWSVIGGSAAILLGVVQDWVLLASGILVVTLELHRVSRKLSDAQSSA
jgi:Family of unknown function (DUF6064)